MTKPKKKRPTWTDVKKQLAELDRPALINVVQDLYKASKANQLFLLARFVQSDDTLEPFKATIDRWVNPSWQKKQDFSVSKAKKAISDYKKAVGDPEGLAELMVFYCECAVKPIEEICYEDESFFIALEGMFDQALSVIVTLDAGKQANFIERLQNIKDIARNWGGGTHDTMTAMQRQHGFDE